MDSREAAERARLAETFLFRGAPPEAVELARTDPRTLRQENGKGGVIYAPHAFRRCLGVVLEGRVQASPVMKNKNTCQYCPYSPVCAREYSEKDVETDRPDSARSLAQMRETLEKGEIPNG